MAPDIPPAIVRGHCEKDDEAEVLSTPFTTVGHTPGMGVSGYRIEVVEYECPRCGFDRMVRRFDQHPHAGNEYRYWCLFPNCPHYLRDMLGHSLKGSYPQGGTNRPTEFQETERTV